MQRLRRSCTRTRRVPWPCRRSRRARSPRCGRQIRHGPVPVPRPSPFRRRRDRRRHSAWLRLRRAWPGGHACVGQHVWLGAEAGDFQTAFMQCFHAHGFFPLSMVFRLPVSTGARFHGLPRIRVSVDGLALRGRIGLFSEEGVLQGRGVVVAAAGAFPCRSRRVVARHRCWRALRCSVLRRLHSRSRAANDFRVQRGWKRAGAIRRSGRRGRTGIRPPARSSAPDGGPLNGSPP